MKPSKVTQMSKSFSSIVLANKLKNIINCLTVIGRSRAKLVGIVSKWGAGPFPPPLYWKTAFSLHRQRRNSAWRSMFQACCASENVGFPGRFEHRHPELHKVEFSWGWGCVARQLYCFALHAHFFEWPPKKVVFGYAQMQNYSLNSNSSSSSPGHVSTGHCTLIHVSKTRT